MNMSPELKAKFEKIAPPKDGQKEPKTGKVWSDLYGGYVPTLYAQGR